MPLLVIAAVAIVSTTGGSSSKGSTPPGPLTLAAPPFATQQAAACTKVLTLLPVQLNKLAPRAVHTTPDTPFVVAWGDPAVILRCGVARPVSLKPGSSAQYFQNGNAANGPFFDVTKGKDGNVFTTVDRAAYVSITVPSAYQGATQVPPLSDAIAKALPAVCSVPDNNGNSGTLPLCTQRR